MPLIRTKDISMRATVWKRNIFFPSDTFLVACIITTFVHLFSTILSCPLWHLSIIATFDPTIRAFGSCWHASIPHEPLAHVGMQHYRILPTLSLWPMLACSITTFLHDPSLWPQYGMHDCHILDHDLSLWPRVVSIHHCHICSPSEPSAHVACMIATFWTTI